MLKEIKYNGYSASPSDYLSPDGDLAYALNVIPERGSLQPLHAPQVIACNLPGDILAVHRVGTEEHYIMYVNGALVWTRVEELNSVPNELLQEFTGVQSVTPIGNTLAVLDGNGTIHYFLWRNDAYSNLGTQLPELEATASLNTHIYNLKDLRSLFEEEGLDFIGDDGAKNDLLLTGGDGWLDADKIDAFYLGQKTFRSFDDGHYKEAKNNVYNRVFGVLNSCRKAMHDKGLFCEPFFIRFAYRLYDGTYCRHTTPLLLCPNSWGQPVTTLDIAKDGTTYFDPKIIAASLFVDIKAQNLHLWKDIITHVDVFVTSPRINYSDSPEAMVGIAQLPFANKDEESWSFTTEGQPLLMSGFPTWENLVPTYELSYSGREPISIPGLRYIHLHSIFKNPTNSRELYYFEIPDPNFTIHDEDGNILVSRAQNIGISSYNNTEYGFFPLKAMQSKTIYSSHAAQGFATQVGTSVLSSRTFENHHYIKLKRTDGELYEQILTEYNNFYRLTEISTDSLVAEKGYYGQLAVKENVINNITVYPTLSDLGQQNNDNIVSTLFNYNNRLNIIVKGEMLPVSAPLKSQNPLVGIGGEDVLERAYVKVVENSQTSYYRLPDVQAEVRGLKIVYFAYPKATAVELEVYYTDSHNTKYVTSIPLTRHPFLNLSYAFNMFDEVTAEVHEVASIPDYPQTGILYGNKIKTSNVNNPFIFSEENTSELPVGKILALSTAAKALSQGQFGQFPLYAFTDEGIWALEVTGTGTYAGRQVLKRDICTNHKSITQIDDAVLFTSDRGIMLLAGSETTCISEILDGEVFDVGQLKHLGEQIQMDSWDNYRQNIQMLYCYPTQKIIVFNPDKEYFYVYSLESKQWAIQNCAIKTTVNNFPQAYAINRDDELVDYAVEGDALPGAFVTRPLKLDAPDVHKTITAIIQRGQFKTGNANTLLYGSRDLQTWYPVWGSKDHYLRGMRGTPYKYFRIASAVNLADGESLYGASVQYETKLDNKLR
jgi:hypothetical protein